MTTWANRVKTQISRECLIGTAKTDKTSGSIHLSVLTAPTLAISTVSDGLSSVLAVPSLGALAKHDSSIVGTDDLDQKCWPHSSAMTSAEIATFTARHARFTRRSVAKADSDTMAEKMLNRDRQGGDWFSYLECCNLIGSEATSWHCGNWRRAGVALRSADNGLPRDFVHLFQHCDGFQAVPARPNF
jgi:hypothetical protein